MPYSWSLVSGSLPDGLGLAPGGIISGTPTVAGTFDFTVNVTDAQSATAQKALAITIIPPATGYDSQFVSQNVPATLQPRQLFVATIRWLNVGSVAWDGASGFSILSQNPPNNLVWGGNTVPWVGPPVRPGEQMELVFQAFAPSQAGIYNFQWQLNQQGVGFFGQMSASVSITVGDPSQPAPLSISGPSSVTAVKGTSLTVSMTASGGTTPYTWSVAAGALPAGIVLNPATGALAGTPTAEGSFAATVQVTDSRSQTAQKALTFTVTVPAAPPLEITTSTLPGATKGVSFSQQLSAIGGKPPYTWTITSGALPGGLIVAAGSGVISGTPNAAGSFSFTVTATDADSHTASKVLSISVAAPPVSVSAIPALETLKGLSFNYQLSANGGTTPYTWSVSSGALPSGLNLNATGGLISGTPSVGGLFLLTVTVRDSASSSASATVQIKVIDPETIPSISKVKYKGGKKLIVVGNRFNPAALLLIDGNPVSYRAGDGQMVVKPIALAAGRHEIRIVNPGAVFSAPFMLTVQ